MTDSMIEQNTADSGMGDFLRILLAIFLPPVAVATEVGLKREFWINLLLTLLGYIPGLVHAVWTVARR